MKFLNPSGLWLLLGIPVLIIIYIIKSKHEERAVASTFIWKLSEKFMKQRLPMQRLKKLLVFITQLAMICAISLLAAKPVINHGDAIHYIIILDSSASMQTANDEGESRFERAVSAIEEIAEETEKGHKVSLIIATETANCAFSNITSQNIISRSLSSLSCGNGSADLNAAIVTAEELADSSMVNKVIVFTDKECQTSADVSCVNLADEEWNVSVSTLNYKLKSNETVFTGIITDTRTETLTVGLKINGKLKEAQKVSITAGEAMEVAFTQTISDFDTAEIFVEVNDGLTMDNSYAVCRSGKNTVSVLVYSSSPKYLQNVFAAQEGCTVTVVSPSEEANLSGYSLYIFDGSVPEKIPEDGSVLFINTEYLPEGITVKDRIEEEGSLKNPQGADGSFYEDLLFSETIVAKYTSLTADTEWKTLLECDDSSVLMARTLANGLKEMVLAFDIHDSNLSLKTSFVILARNILEYSVPQILEESNVVIGESLNLALLPGASSLYVKTPSGGVDQISRQGLYGVYVPEETGVFTAVETTEGGGKYMDFFVHIPDSEMIGYEEAAILSFEIENAASEQVKANQDIAFWVALVILLLVLVEWGVYYYDQF